MYSNPKISVLLPVFNCEKFIKESVDSILNQTYKNFELIIIDDKSNDNTLQIVKKYSDERIILIQKKENSGYTNSLNYGIKIAKGEFIARMDGDDISFPTRFEEQLKVMIENPNIFVCGSKAIIIGTNNYIDVPETNENIFKSFLNQNGVIHPSVMIRKEVFEKYEYDCTFEPAEDYNLWSRLILDYSFYNIQKPLLYYRKHNSNVSKQRSELQRNLFLKSLYYFYCNISKNKPSIEIQDFIDFNNNKIIPVSEIIKIYKLSNSLIEFNKFDLKFEAYLLKKKNVQRIFVNLPLKKAYKIFFVLSFLDKLRFIKYYLVNSF